MKIIAYHVQGYEEKPFAEWSERTGIEVELHKELITPETIEWAKGFDGVTTQQVIPVKEEEVFAKLEEYGIKQIASRTAGVDMFGLETAKEHGVAITNVPRYSPTAIAEMAVTKAMLLLRNLKHIERAQSEGDFTWAHRLIAREMRTCTVGVIGTGAIGLTAARLFKGLGAKVIGYDVFKNPNAEGILEYRDSVDEVLAESDVISLHLPLMESTHHILNADNIPKIKKGAIVVNTGRGGLIDVEALIPYLENGHLTGAGLDVLEDETIYVNQNCGIDKIKGTYIEKLMSMDNVDLTGHFAFFTESAVGEMVSIALDNIKTQVETGEVVNCMNK